jgi:hypothetical protein
VVLRNDRLKVLCLAQKMVTHTCMDAMTRLVVMVYILLALDICDSIFSRKDMLAVADNEVVMLLVVDMHLRSSVCG